METLVIKNNLLSGGTEKLYRDVIVSTGTLFCFDFSNKGCVQNDNLTTVKDLAVEAKTALGISNDVQFLVTDRGTVPALTSKKGYPLVNLGSYSSDSNDNGLNIGGVDQYLFEKQPEKMLFTFWMGVEPLGGIDGAILFMSSGDGATRGSSNNMRIQGATSSLSGRLGGLGFANIPRNGIMQYSIERQGVGLPNKLYVNGIFFGFAVGNATAFAQATRVMSIGVKTPGEGSNSVIYRVFAEDLDKSGRNALDVIQEDYSYVNAINEFDGIEPRPFANVT